MAVSLAAYIINLFLTIFSDGIQRTWPHTGGDCHQCSFEVIRVDQESLERLRFFNVQRRWS